MKNVFENLIKMALTMALVACAGQSSDPLKEYDAVKRVPLHEEPSDITIYEAPLLRLEVLGGSEENYGVFTANKRNHIDIKAVQLSQNNIAKISSLGIENFKGADQPTVQRISNDTLRISWSPKESNIPIGRSSTQKRFTVVALYDALGRKAAREEKEITITINRDLQTPQITGTSGLKGIRAQEGKKVTFSVTVKDPNYNGTGIPEIMFPKQMYSNTEAFMADASVYESQNLAIKQNPAYNGSGVFTFFHVLDLEKLPEHRDRKGNIDQNAATVKLCLNIRVNSVENITSGVTQECFDAEYSSQSADVKFASSDRKIIAGKENKIAFSLGTANSLSSLSIKNEKDISNLAGEKSLECNPENDRNTKVNCLLTWTPTCNVKANTARASKLNLKVVSTLNKKSKETAVDEQFEIDHADCEAKEAAEKAEKAAADAKAAQEKAAAEEKAAEEKAVAEAAKKAEETAKQSKDNSENKS